MDFAQGCFRIPFCTLVLIATSLFLSRPLYSAESQSEKLHAEIELIKANLSSTQRNITQVEHQLETLDQEIASSTRQLVSIRQDISQERNDLSEIRRQLSEVMDEKRRQTDTLAQQIRTRYMLGREPLLKMALGQNNPAKIGRLVTYYDYLNQAYVGEIEHLARRKDALSRLNTQLEQRTKNLETLLTRHQSRLRDFENQKQRRTLAVDKLRIEESDSTQRLAKMLADFRQLERLTEKMGHITDLSDSKASSGIAFAKFKGSLPWPVEGKLLAQFGGSRVSNGQLSWRGILIDAEEGDVVKSVAPGTVVFSDWLRGYGYMLIVDHGAGYLSLYGHNQALMKLVGDKVKQGDKIALVGQTGTTRKPSLYFEIRFKGEPVNPQRWIASAR
ncbi:MAG: peptidoglycan DD-metalloendopeptidase family protein [Gammaproteobacteria bacterium]|nr:peptidoglycan DD-metalloendopeptidase family protein [Gammaproteobacteria bacterium]